MEHNKALDWLCVWQLATPLGPSQRRNLIVNSNLPKEMWYQWFRWLNTRSIPQCIVREFPSLLSQLKHIGFFFWVSMEIPVRDFIVGVLLTYFTGELMTENIFHTLQVIRVALPFCRGRQNLLQNIISFHCFTHRYFDIFTYSPRSQLKHQ